MVEDAIAMRLLMILDARPVVRSHWIGGRFLTACRGNRVSTSSDAHWNLETHALALIFPLMICAEFDDLVESVRLNGLTNEIVLWEGKILDGRNRYLACKAAGVTPRMKSFTGSHADAVRFVCEQNLTRRHMTESQRAMAAQALAVGAGAHSDGRGCGTDHEGTSRWGDGCR
jgi:hypothetical protein